jgi:hypothetical protein
MAGEPAFGTALAKHIRRRTALVATTADKTTADKTQMLGGLLFTATPGVSRALARRR